ncbi:70-kilodalton heat shock protein [Perkinsus chesapeaki]|uniref:70-kilodalton heat shock protein n=1 Tax=Perkinsus chesapeaki TaxID=330153 RepID=A0A7J6LGV7_PERCH|nr:70-kilodalton heat shock protein [Perkinsus chesapeaki]
MPISDRRSFHAAPEVAVKKRKVPVGIDLGTTYSCVAAWVGDSVRTISNEFGNLITPSYVSFTDSGRVVGEAAMAQVTTNPKNTVYETKRLIGRRFSDPLVQHDIKRWPFKVVCGPGDKPLIEVTE